MAAPPSTIPTGINMPIELRRDLEASAKEMCRTLSAEMIFRLRESLKADRRAAVA
jgi:hypothetical protein